MHRAFFVAGSASAVLAVALGAFGAHALKEHLSADMLEVYQTGVHYQTVHALALLIVALARTPLGERTQVKWAGWLFVVGTVVFSGSLYALAMTGIRIFGAITPIGGVCFLAGWVLLFLAGLSRTRVGS